MDGAWRMFGLDSVNVYVALAVGLCFLTGYVLYKARRPSGAFRERFEL